MSALRGVIDPELGSDIVDLGMARQATVAADGAARVTIALTTAGCPLRAQIQREVKARIAALPGISSVAIDWTEMTAEQRSATMAKARWNVRGDARPNAVPPTTRVICVASGKGGVGKSSVTVNVAATLADRGYKVGVLDADIWGFSVPRMLGLEGRLQGRPGEKKIVPHSITLGPTMAAAGGRLDVVSMGLLVEHEEEALMWRGLMLNRAVQHFLEDVDWPEDLDYLLVDMPPGTGDVQMGLARMLPQAETLIVTTPALAAQKVASRAATMARKSFLHVSGVVENMSAFVAPDGTSHAVFGTGGGQALADDIGAPLLAQVPLEGAVAAGGDHGEPVALRPGAAGDAFRALAAKLVAEVSPPIDMSGCSARLVSAMESALGPVATA